MFCPSHTLVAVALVAVSLGLSGCRSAAHVSHQVAAPQVQAVAYLEAADDWPVVSDDEQNWIGPRSLDECIGLGMHRNSEIQEARLLVEALIHRIPQAAALPDPVLGLTAYPSSVQTAAGEQDFAVSLNQKFPAKGKRIAKAGIAQAELDAARARVVAVELKVVEQIKKAYFQLGFVQQAISIIEMDQQQLELIETVVDQMYRVKQEVTQQDVLQVQIAQSRLATELAQFQQQKKSARAKLAALLHLPHNSEIDAIESSSLKPLDHDIDQLYQQALSSQPELQAQLAVIEREQQAVRLAELENCPDLALGFNWISTADSGISPVANGDDAFMLTMGMNLPVYRNRMDAGVREAYARSMASSFRYDRLKDEMLESVVDLVATIEQLQTTLQLFRDDVIPKQELTLEQSIDDYQVGKVDFLQLINNWRQLLRYHIQEKRLEADLLRAVAGLDRQVASSERPADLPFDSDAEGK